MKKSYVKLVVIIALLAIVILMVPAFIVSKLTPDMEPVIASNTITVKDGQLDQTAFYKDFHIDRSDTYTLWISILPEGVSRDEVFSVNSYDLGFITTFIITDENENVVYSSVQGSVYLDAEIYLEAGDYRLNYLYSADGESFQALAQAQICSIKESYELAEGIGFDDFAKDSVVTFNYELTCRSERESTLFNISLVLMIMAGVLLMTLLVREIFILTGAGNGRNYDERQILEQGRGYKLGYLTLLAELMIVIALDGSGLINDRTSVFLYGGALYISLMVYAVYCIWHESYFSIDPSSKGTVIILLSIFLLNLVVSIVNWKSGLMIVDGVPTFRFLNVFCCVAFLVMFITLILRKVKTARAESSEEEEDE